MNPRCSSIGEMTDRPLLLYSPATSVQFLHSLNVCHAAFPVSCPLLPLIYDSPHLVLSAQPIYASTGPMGQDPQKTIVAEKTDEKGLARSRTSGSRSGAKVEGVSPVRRNFRAGWLKKSARCVSNPTFCETDSYSRGGVPRFIHVEKRQLIRDWEKTGNVVNTSFAFWVNADRYAGL